MFPPRKDVNRTVGAAWYATRAPRCGDRKMTGESTESKARFHCLIIELAPDFGDVAPARNKHRSRAERYRPRCPWLFASKIDAVLDRGNTGFGANIVAVAAGRAGYPDAAEQ